jgi:hypothetical protein
MVISGNQRYDFLEEPVKAKLRAKSQVLLYKSVTYTKPSCLPPYQKFFIFFLEVTECSLYNTECSMVFNLIGDLTMNISEQDAQDSLSQIQTVSVRTRKTVAAHYAGPLLILWGLVCIFAYIGTHFFVHWANHIWATLNIIGAAGTFFICRKQLRSAKPTKIPVDKKMGWKIFWFWTLLFIYITIWLNILRPHHGIQLNAFILTAVMFAYLVIVFLTQSLFMVWLALAVTIATLFGLYIIPKNYYCLWMAFAAGGPIFATGLYARIFWT